MSKIESYRTFGEGSKGYGWAGMTPIEFKHWMKLAEERFCKLKEEFEFDAIAFCGSSGCAIAFSLASRFAIPLIYVRKAGEKTHGSKVECNHKHVEIKKYLIVDDFPETGATVFRIINRIAKTAKKRKAYPAEPVGVLCFDPYVDRDREIIINDKPIKLFSSMPTRS